MSRAIKIALAGNPNSGKTTIFNNLTGARQHVGNYPGVTVEKKQGRRRHGDLDIDVVDLPGTYSLTARSAEELVARNFILKERPDVVVDVIDSSNLERNLYLAVQLIELGAPLVLAFNMSDVAQSRGIEFDLAQLSAFLGAPIVCTVGHKGVGTEQLLDAVAAVARGDAPVRRGAEVQYGPEIETEIRLIQGLIESGDVPTDGCDPRWVAVKLLENDEEVLDHYGSDELRTAVAHSTAHLESVLGDPAEVLIADQRYGFISGACQEAVRITVEARHSVSDKIDAVLTHRVLGLPIFAAMMYLVFQLTFTLGEPCVDFLDRIVNEDFAGWVNQLWAKGSDSLVRSLIVDGVLGGVGSVMVFVPLIMLLFLAIAILEDSGYMARAAFIMDRLMHKIGLHGKSFVPMLIGFGCSVPAIMATRTLESRRDRLTTMLVIPLMSCGARMPIYMLILPAFFPVRWQTPLLWCIYMIGIVLAIVCAKLLRATLLRGESTPFVMELPPYRMPTLRGLLVHMWDRVWMYIKRAGTILLGFAILLWAANTFPRKAQFDRDYDAEIQQAADAYVSGLSALNAPLGLAAGSTIVQQAVRAELALAAEQQKVWKHEAAWARARQAKDAAFQRLLRGEGGSVLAGFLDARGRIVAVRKAFKRAVKDHRLEAGSLGYKKQELLRDEALAALRRAGPKAYAAAASFLDDHQAPMEEQIQRLRALQGAEELAHSVVGRTGAALAPALRPLGFDWRIGTALVGALGAKEVFVAQMGIVFSLGGEATEESESLRQRLRQSYSPLVAFCIMLFCLISAPCVATMAVTLRESNSWKWMLFQVGGLTVLAYGVTLAVYQVGRLFV